MGNCSEDCGGGMRTNTRTKNVEEAHGGVCVGEATITESCNTDECPGKKSAHKNVMQKTS